MSCVFTNYRSYNVIKTLVRYKNPPHHWSVLRKKKRCSEKALEHFDSLYGDIYGKSWLNIRKAMLSKKHHYVAIVNNYSDTKRICKELESFGAMNMKCIYNVNKQLFESQNLEIIKKKKENIKLDNSNQKDFVVTETNLKNEFNQCNKNTEIIEDTIIDEPSKSIQLQSIEKGVTIINNADRIIRSGVGISASQLNEFIPTSKIKGKDDFIFESDNYVNYNRATDFLVKIEEEQFLNFPNMLSLYIFESSKKGFPKPKTGSTGVIDYFTVDTASVLPVLSLDLQPCDRVLDMCAGPGAKSLIALQTLNPAVIVANDNQKSRIQRINNFFNELVSNIEAYDERFIITMKDARTIDDKNIYNKILVDVPCTTDRHVLHEDDNNIFKTSRLKERLSLPERQTEILVNALRLVSCGGTVVYSTCTLSPIQNDGVVHVALKKVFEQYNNVFVIKDQTQALNPLKNVYDFGNCGLKYGHIVIPTVQKNNGPLYFCKMVKIK